MHANANLSTQGPYQHTTTGGRVASLAALGAPAAVAVQHNARTHSGPLSTGATVAMDGGVADTARANIPVLSQVKSSQVKLIGGARGAIETCRIKSSPHVYQV